MEVSRGFARAAGNVVIFWVAAGVVAAQTLEERLLIILQDYGINCSAFTTKPL